MTKKPGPYLAIHLKSFGGVFPEFVTARYRGKDRLWCRVKATRHVYDYSRYDYKIAYDMSAPAKDQDIQKKYLKIQYRSRKQDDLTPADKEIIGWLNDGLDFFLKEQGK